MKMVIVIGNPPCKLVLNVAVMSNVEEFANFVSLNAWLIFGMMIVLWHISEVEFNVGHKISQGHDDWTQWTERWEKE